MPTQTLIDEATLTRELEAYEAGAVALDRHLAEAGQISWRARVDREILVRILEVVGPPPDRVRECIRQILGQISIMTVTFSSDHTPAPGAVRRKLLETARELKRARISVEGLLNSYAARILTTDYEIQSGETKPGLLWEDLESFLALAKRIESVSITFADGLEVPPGKPPKSETKMSAAAFSFDLLTSFQRKPTLTIDAAYFNVASLLYEAVTGKASVSLEHACREYWKVRDTE